MTISISETRYYHNPEKTLDECRNHGRDHRAYGWGRQIDPRWSAEQVAAYIAGYDGQ